jgi:hypothetical protein
MIYVVVEEVISRLQMHEKTDIATMGVITGFVAMMVLDMAFGLSSLVCFFIQEPCLLSVLGTDGTSGTGTATALKLLHENKDLRVTY